MACPEGGSSGKGKGKARSRDGDGSSTEQGERTPPPNDTRGGTAAGARSLALRLCGRVSDWEVEAPRRRAVGAFAVVVSMLALARNILLPFPDVYGEDYPSHLDLDGDLIRLVLAEQLEGVTNTIQKEDRSFESVLARRAEALKEIQGWEQRLKASVAELEELEGLGKAVHEDNSGDAGLTTEVSRAQDRLRDLHHSVAGELDGFKQQLEGQAEAMRGVRDRWAKIGQVQERTGDRVAAGAVHEKLEEKLEQYLGELSGFHRSVEATVDELSPDIITAADLEVLLQRAAEPSERTGTGAGDSDDGDGPTAEQSLRSLSEEAVDLATRKMAMAGSDARGGGDDGGDGGCVSEEVLREQVDVAIEKLTADGTGRRDYANAAIGGKVLTSKGMVSDTYTPPAWWMPSWYWHRAGVENGIVTALSVRVARLSHYILSSIGPVESVISDDSSLGACWAMAGSEGVVTIQLPQEVTVDGISIEHASRMITTESTSAPREFQVSGARTKGDPFVAKLGGGVYEIDGRPIQTFPIEPLGVKFTVIQVKILSNWGNPDYTCLYRVRVHGS